MKPRKCCWIELLHEGYKGSRIPVVECPIMESLIEFCACVVDGFLSQIMNSFLIFFGGAKKDNPQEVDERL